MEKCGIVQCYYNHDGRCGIGSFIKADNVFRATPMYCPRKEGEQ